MRTARPPPLQNPKRGPHGGLRVHRRLVQPPSPPFRPRLSFTDQLRKDSANRKSNRKPNTVHRNGVAPAAETSYQAYGWEAPRRLVVVRETFRERPEARGRKLLEVPGYTFHVLVTTLRHDPVPTWRFYNSRAESENRIKELKQDFGADGFCLHSFDGTEAAFRLICFLFNLIADFKREVTQNEAPRLMTLRTRLLVIGAIRGADGRQHDP